MEFEKGRAEPGMRVFSSDGERVGTVIAVSEDRFEVEKGFFFPNDYFLRYDAIDHADAEGLHLRYSLTRLRTEREERASRTELAEEDHRVDAAAARLGFGPAPVEPTFHERVQAADDQRGDEETIRETRSDRLEREADTPRAPGIGEREEKENF